MEINIAVDGNIAFALYEMVTKQRRFAYRAKFLSHDCEIRTTIAIVVMNTPSVSQGSSPVAKGVRRNLGGS